LEISLKLFESPNSVSLETRNEYFFNFIFCRRLLREWIDSATGRAMMMRKILKVFTLKTFHWLTLFRYW
jgi:hypothetical protein